MTGKKEPGIRIRVTVVLRREDGRICFVRHRKNGRRYWLLPGGGQGMCEELEQAARRELEEELNISVVDLRFICLRETFSLKERRHIHFPIFEGIEPNFSKLAKGSDPRVEGADFFDIQEIRNHPIYPCMVDDLIKISQGVPLKLFETLPWIT